MAGGSQLVLDMQALSRIEGRFAGSEGERQMLDAVRERLPDGVTGRVEGFVGHVNPVFVLGVHGVIIFVAGVVGI